MFVLKVGACELHCNDDLGFSWAVPERFVILHYITLLIFSIYCDSRELFNVEVEVKEPIDSPYLPKILRKYGLLAPAERFSG